MPSLVVPTTNMHAAWLEAHAEWGPGVHEDGFGLRPSDDVSSVAGFAVWVARLLDPSRAAVFRWIVEDGRVLGGAALRYGDQEALHWVGNVGYGVRPSARGRGVATWALGALLGEARALGLDRVLAVCAPDNAASAATIERCGGVLEGVAETPYGPARRYWLPL